MGSALLAHRVVAERKANELVFPDLRNIPLKHRQLDVQVLGVHNFKQHVGGRHALPDAHVHRLHKAAFGRAQRGRAHHSAPDGQAGQAQAGGLGVGFHLQSFVFGLGALVVFLGRYFLPVQLALPLVLGFGKFELAAGFLIILLQLHKIGVADGGQHLPFAHPRALQQIGTGDKPAHWRTHGHEVFRGHIEHAIDFEAAAHGPLGKGAEANAAQLLLVRRERDAVRNTVFGHFFRGGSFGSFFFIGRIFLFAAASQQANQ